MNTHTETPFEIAGWDQTAYDAPDMGPRLSRATVRKTFSGPLTGESTAELLMCQSDDDTGLAYTAVERVTGNLDGRAGSFVIQHGANGTETDTARSLGVVVPGSGTGDLRELRGTVAFRHDERGAVMTLDYDFA